jgi:small conductance mechanosensitive channel
MDAAPWLFQVTSLEDWRTWLADHEVATHATRVAIIIAVLFALELFFRRVVGGVLVRAIGRASASRGDDVRTMKRRGDTLFATLNWAFGIFLLFLGAGLVLAELGLNVSALIAGVGVVGIALGLGAQTLVKDVINGLFILIEDQYAVGDTVTIAGLTGEVVELTPRRTVLRDGQGSIHTVPNSAITVASNLSPSLNRLRVDVIVRFGDVDRAAQIASEVASETARDRAGDLITAPRLVDQSVAGNGDVRLVLLGDTRPKSRWPVEADLRRRLKRRFDAERVSAHLEGPADAKK